MPVPFSKHWQLAVLIRPYSFASLHCCSFAFYTHIIYIQRQDRQIKNDFFKELIRNNNKHKKIFVTKDRISKFYK